jgi:tmRNA-binding protein
MHQISMLECIYALKESDKSEGRFSPVFETAEAVWNFEIEDFDKLGLLVLGLEIRSKSAPRLSLLQQSAALVEKVTYLEEDFKLVEHDRNTNTSQSRNHARLL